MLHAAHVAERGHSPVSGSFLIIFFSPDSPANQMHEFDKVKSFLRFDAVRNERTGTSMSQGYR